MIKRKRLLIRRVCVDDWKAIQGIWADAAKSTFSQFDKPNANVKHFFTLLGNEFFTSWWQDHLTAHNQIH